MDDGQSDGGRVYSYHDRASGDESGLLEDVPYVYAIVELEEGPRVTTNVVGCPGGA